MRRAGPCQWLAVVGAEAAVAAVVVEVEAEDKPTLGGGAVVEEAPEAVREHVAEVEVVEVLLR